MAITPAGVATLIKEGFRAVHVESGAGVAAEFSVSISLTMPLTHDELQLSTVCTAYAANQMAMQSIIVPVALTVTSGLSGIS